MSVRHQWVLSCIAGVTVAVLCLVELNRAYAIEVSSIATWAFLVFVATAIAAARLQPGVALAAGWAAGLTQLLGPTPLVLAEMVLVVVLFSAARWGQVGTVVAAGATVPVAPVLARLVGVDSLYYSKLGSQLVSSVSLTALGLGALALLGLPWLLGLTLRFVERADRAQKAQQSAEEQAVHAQEIARLRQEQNRLARDVHDVVGHSLAVILVQAESAQFLDDADTGRLKATMANIAGSARTSLQDVRSVLSPDPTRRVPVRLDSLLDSVVDGSGRKVAVEHVGSTRPLPPELEEVSYRVLQEMLTNALKHGDRGRPLHVTVAWPQGGGPGEVLRIEVVNGVAADSDTRDTSGSGIDSMRRRLGSVGARWRDPAQARSAGSSADRCVRPSAPPRVGDRPCTGCTQRAHSERTGTNRACQEHLGDQHRSPELSTGPGSTRCLTRPSCGSACCKVRAAAGRQRCCAAGRSSNRSR